MTQKNKQRLFLALLNAEEFIKGHVETGLEPEDAMEDSEDGLSEYNKACKRAAKLIRTLAKKYENTRNNNK